MNHFYNKAEVNIYGTQNCWSLDSNGEGFTKAEVNLEIQGTTKSGYNLVMSPKGFFTADYWFSTLEEAYEDAEEMFGVKKEEWKKNS
jgi:hypothetical protein